MRGGRRRPRPAGAVRHQPGPGPQRGLDHQHLLRRRERDPHRPGAGARHIAAHAAGRRGVRGGGHRPVLEPAADLRRRARRRAAGQPVPQVPGRLRRRGRGAAQHAVHRPLRRAAVDSQAEAGRRPAIRVRTAARAGAGTAAGARPPRRAGGRAGGAAGRAGAGRRQAARVHQRRHVRDRVPVSRPAGVDVGAGVAVPRRLRRGRGGGDGPLHHRARAAMGASRCS